MLSLIVRNVRDAYQRDFGKLNDVGRYVLVSFSVCRPVGLSVHVELESRKKGRKDASIS